MICFFDKAVIKGNEITILDQSYDIVKGKHSIWIPSMEAKLTWSYKGEITPLLKEEYKGDVSCWSIDSLQSIMNEYTIMKELEKESFAPPIGNMIHIRHVISSDFGDDEQGIYGYYMKDANKLSKGKYTFEKFVELFFDRITFSDWTLERTDREKGIYGGALGDLQKPDNVVNGYLIDVRRSLFDNMIWKDLSTDAYKEINNDK